MKRFAVIVAGGIGTRMQSGIPKQFLQLCGKPVLFHTLERFASVSGITIILTLPKNQIKNWEELCQRYSFQIPHQVVEGGETRFHSVKNGLDQISEEGLVGVHDGVRPLISKELIESIYSEAEKFGNAVPAIPVNDSIRQVNGERNFYTDRNHFRLMQTPQCFQVSILKKAFKKGYGITFTDEANVAEADGNHIHLVPGEIRNIKITTPDDLLFAEAILKKEK